jgi:hypothetical protein
MIMTVLSIGGLIALLAGGSWFSYKISQSNGSTITTSYYLDKATSVVNSSTSGNSTSTSTYSNIDQTYANLNKLFSSIPATNCVSSGQTTMGLTIASLALHAAFLALFIGKGGNFSGNFKHSAAAILFIGMALEVAAVAYFDTNSKCVKYFSDTTSNAATTAGYSFSITVAA